MHSLVQRRCTCHAENAIPVKTERNGLTHLLLYVMRGQKDEGKNHAIIDIPSKVQSGEDALVLRALMDHLGTNSSCGHYITKICNGDTTSTIDDSKVYHY